MFRYIKKIVVLLILGITVIGLSSCKSNKYYNNIFSLNDAFNTVSYVQLFTYNKKLDEEEFEKVEKGLNKVLNDLDDLFNIQVRDGNKPNTDLYLINTNAGIKAVKVDEEVIFVVKKALEIAKLTIVDKVALFDPTIAPVWQAWDFTEDRLFTADLFGEGNKIENPVPKDLGALIKKVDYNKVIIDEEASTVFLEEAGMGLDLGSIVKGYAADKIKEYLISLGYERAIIDVGRNIHTLGSYWDKEFNDTGWIVKIQRPFYNFFTEEAETETFGTLSVSDLTVVTSGTYEKYIMSTEDVMYHHIIDPRTGMPFDNKVLSITVVTKLSIMGDGYSTALFSLGFEKGMELVNQTNGLDTIWVVENSVTNKKEVYISAGLKDNFEFNQAVENVGYVYKGVYQ